MFFSPSFTLTKCSNITSLAIHPIQPHYFAVCGDDGSLKLFDRRVVRSSEGPKIMQSYKQAHGSIQTVLTLAGTRKTTKLNHAVTSIQFHSTGNILYSSGTDGTIRLWDLNRGQLSYIVDTAIGYINIDSMISAIKASSSHPVKPLAISLSGDSFLSATGIPSYSPSKHRIRSMTRSAARKLLQDGRSSSKQEEIPLLTEQPKPFPKKKSKSHSRRKTRPSSPVVLDSENDIAGHKFALISLHPDISRSSRSSKSKDGFMTKVNIKVDKSSIKSLGPSHTDGHILLWKTSNLIQRPPDIQNQIDNEKRRKARLKKSIKARKRAERHQRIENLYKGVNPALDKIKARPKTNSLPWIRKGGGYYPSKSPLSSMFQELEQGNQPQHGFAHSADTKEPSQLEDPTPIPSSPTSTDQPHPRILHVPSISVEEPSDYYASQEVLNNQLLSDISEIANETTANNLDNSIGPQPSSISNDPLSSKPHPQILSEATKSQKPPSFPPNDGSSSGDDPSPIQGHRIEPSDLEIDPDALLEQLELQAGEIDRVGLDGK